MAKTRRRSASTAPSYEAKDVQSLQGAEAVRATPGMYVTDTASEGLHHLVWEILNNSIDEHLAGHCTEITLSLDTRRHRIIVKDNGRGVPVAINPDTDEPTVVSTFTRLHTGGKFGKAAYAISGGLHGCGSTAVNALSDKMVVRTVRSRRLYSVSFCRGVVTEPLAVLRKARKGERGTTVMFHPDKEMFGSHKISPMEVRKRLVSTAYLCPGLTLLFVLNGEKENLTKKKGLSGFLVDKMTGKEKSMFSTGPLLVSVNGEFREGDNGRASFVVDPTGSEGVDLALHWTSGTEEQWFSYVNMIMVPDGGTHVGGAKKAITRVLSRAGKKKGVIGDDYREGLRIAMHIKLRRPHFEGQTKRRLNNPECSGMSESLVGEALRSFFSDKEDLVTAIVKRAEAMSKARASMKAAKQIASQDAYSTTEGRKGLPAKLVTALRCTPGERELFMVEGDSAGGSAVVGRNGYNQEILPLKGKPPNPIQPNNMAKLAKLFGNSSIDDIVRAIGAGHDVEVIGQSCDPDKSRHDKVIMLADKDVDGMHITVLWLGFFLRFMFPLVEAGKLWVAVPPLYVGRWPKGRVYGDSVEEIREKAAAKGVKKPLVTYVKGLGEMQAADLSATAMDPDSRRLIQIKADRSSLDYMMRLLGTEVSFRKEVLGLL